MPKEDFLEILKYSEDMSPRNLIVVRKKRNDCKTTLQESE